MEENIGRQPLFKKVDQAIFAQIDQFKKTPNYNTVQDFYNGLDEEQQKVFKGSIILVLILIPLMFLGFIWLQNHSLREDYELKKSILSKASEILGESRSFRSVAPQIVSTSPIDGESMMTSRLSNILSAIGADLSKIQVSNFSMTPISPTLISSEADFAFKNVSTAELMNVFTAMIQREKFRIETVNIERDESSNLLSGQFHAIHYSSVPEKNEEF